MQGVLESRTKQVSAIWGDRCFLCAGWPYALASAALATVFALWLVSFPSSLRASLCLLSSFHLAFLFLHKGRQGRPLLTKAELESDVNDYSMPECSVPAHCPRVWLLTWRASRPPPPLLLLFPAGDDSHQARRCCHLQGRICHVAWPSQLSSWKIIRKHIADRSASSESSK